jgi:two-component system, NtrC family, C4-dicarboxylate transport sensor histidine kinase DctB
MSSIPKTRALPVLQFLLATLVISAGVWWLSFSAALNQAAENGRADLALASDRLANQLQGVRERAVLLADHPTLLDLVRNPPALTSEANKLLQEMADKTASKSVFLIDTEGQVLASSLPDLAGDSPGQSLSAKFLAPYRRALGGALGASHFIGADGKRIYAFAAPVFAPDGPVIGVVIVGIDILAIEWNWPADPDAVFFSDDAGVIFVSNRSELILTEKSGHGSGIGSFPPYRSSNFRGNTIWRLDGGRYLPRHALHLTQPMPVVGFTAEILLDLAPARRLAALQAAVAAALALVIGAFALLATQRRRALAERLELEAAANSALEARVQARTRELEDVNRSLRHEIRERQDAEAALKRAQADLVQAGKLSALGQMSAGISHELNQPLMAIRSFAENADLFLERGQPDRAGENLGRISELARRMGRIIKNLRAFARQEHEQIRDVDLVAVVDTALEMAHGKIVAGGVEASWARPAPVWVRGGEVRLQQVVMNLISNAVDAMVESETRRLEIVLEPGAPVRLCVRDTGPGIEDSSKIFDPFYSTKEVGASEGMGLGLSISYGLVQSFGGEIRGRNQAQGGAEFTVELTPGTTIGRAAE